MMVWLNTNLAVCHEMLKISSVLLAEACLMMIINLTTVTSI